ncbi:hypothetical protein GCK32_012422 [Trichostrongylus colubriformis]|uniref:Uncharacterized protein n=1 Tax=Trichostrongylus colubriformis TaxID=6319 RepID=A0AAN8FQ07_TRICO
MPRLGQLVYPPHLGKGELHSQKKLCTITFPYDTESQSEAQDMCENSLPFDVKEATHGQSTKCVYERHDIICKSGEFVIGKKCFRIQGKGPSSKSVEGCGSKYHFHVLQNEFERKWVALRLPDKHGDVWSGISDDYWETLHPIGKDNRTEDNRTKRGAMNPTVFSIKAASHSA